MMMLGVNISLIVLVILQLPFVGEFRCGQFYTTIFWNLESYLTWGGL